MEGRGVQSKKLSLERVQIFSGVTHKEIVTYKTCHRENPLMKTES